MHWNCVKSVTIDDWAERRGEFWRHNKWRFRSILDVKQPSWIESESAEQKVKVIYRQTTDRPARITRRKEAEAGDEKKLNENCGKEIPFNAEFIVYRNKFIGMLVGFEDMWDSHLGRISIAKHYIEQNRRKTWLIYPASYKMEPWVEEFDHEETVKTLRKNATGPAQTKSSSPIVFSTKKYRPSRLFRLPKAQSRYISSLVCNPKNGRVYRPVWSRSSIRSAWCDLL